MIYPRNEFPVIGEEPKVDVFEETRRKTVADNENEYQKKWRKNKNGKAKLSPDRGDPFKSKKCTYGERLLRQELGKEIKNSRKEFNEVQNDRLRNRMMMKRKIEGGEGLKISFVEKNKRTKVDQDFVENKKKMVIFEFPNYNPTGLLNPHGNGRLDFVPSERKGEDDER